MGSTMGWLVAMPLAAIALVTVAAGAQQPKDGEQILNESCNSACHDARPVQTSAKDEAGWTKTVNSMLDMGATLSNPDKAVLIPYLVRTHGPIPDGRGKDIVLNTCTLCHDLTRVKNSRHTPEEWNDVLSTMLNEGAPLSDDNFPIVLSYLARNFGAP